MIESPAGRNRNNGKKPWFLPIFTLTGWQTFAITKIKNEMKKQKAILIASRVFMGFSALCMLSVSLMAFANPQSVMDLVQVKLTNTDAFSSIRGVYGGVGFCLFLGIIYMAWKEVGRGLVFLALLWGAYALSRVITIYAEGRLGAFGTQWLVTESCLFCIAMLLILLHRAGASMKQPRS